MLFNIFVGIKLGSNSDRDREIAATEHTHRKTKQRGNFFLFFHLLPLSLLHKLHPKAPIRGQWDEDEKVKDAQSSAKHCDRYRE